MSVRLADVLPLGASGVHWRRHYLDGPAPLVGFSGLLASARCRWSREPDHGVASGGRLQLLMQMGVLYRYIGRSEVGPYSATSLGFGPGPPVARTSVSNSDWIIKVGSGLRF